MKRYPLCFLDIETTGTNSNFNRIIEIGIIKVKDNKIVEKLDSLVNPGTGIPDFIKGMTGITDKDIENAPSFYELSRKLQELFSDSILVAHNVRFDYGFLKNEFRRIDISFSTKHFCSIKLARQLYPNLDYYNLDSIIRNFGINCSRRHRAYDDAKVIFDFYNIARKTFSEKILSQALNIALKKPSIPISISDEILEKLPESAGVYIFYGEDGWPLYIGKSVNLRDRILSHFTNDHSSAKDMQIAQEVRDIQTICTAGELGALLLESTLIKKYKPIYNRMLRDVRKMILLIVSEDKNGFFTVKSQETDKIDVKDTENIVGIFKSRKQMEEHLYELARQFNLCPKLLGLDHSKKFCFYYHLKICKGACWNKELNIKYNVRFSEAFYKYKMKRWIFDSPILIKEKSDIEGGFIIDKWCILGSIKNENDIYEIDREYSFDLDTYKILSKFLSNPPKTLSITKFNTRLDFSSV